MSHITFDNFDSFRGSGLSQDISRGLLFRRDGTDLLQEGLGLGTVALKTKGLTYFSLSCSTWTDGYSIIKEFTVDSVMASHRWPRSAPSPALGRRASYSCWGGVNYAPERCHLMEEIGLAPVKPTIVFDVL
jgi:hypothetical protein